jgi:hypothetical protein
MIPVPFAFWDLSTENGLPCYSYLLVFKSKQKQPILKVAQGSDSALQNKLSGR